MTVRSPEYSISPPHAIDERGLRTYTEDINKQLSEISQELARLRGLDGKTPSIQTPPDYNNNRLKNVGRSSSDADGVNRAELVSNALYRRDGARFHETSYPIKAPYFISTRSKPGNYNNYITQVIKEDGGGGGATTSGLGLIDADKTIDVAPSGAQYTTIQAALDYLNGFWIKNTATVTIKVANGTYTHTSPLYFRHPCGERIRLVGNETSPGSCNLDFNAGTYRIHGIVVDGGYTLGYINGFRIRGYGVDPTDSHAFGLFAYYGGVIRCGPEYHSPPGTPMPGSGTKLTITGFTAALCASKNGSIRADGVNCYKSTSGVFAAHGGVIEFLKGNCPLTGTNVNTVYDLFCYGGLINAGSDSADPLLNTKATYRSAKWVVAWGGIIIPETP